MKILIFGSKGWIGSQFLKLLKNGNYDVVETFVRADNDEEVAKILKDVQPTHVVSFIGRTHGPGYSTIDYLELPGKLKENICDNLYGPLTLAIQCTKANIHYTYLGTGCIFTSNDPVNQTINYNESAIPDFFGSSYSVVKGYTDRLMHNFNDSVLNVRIRMPITADRNPRNFITKITTYDKVCSIANSMTVLPELLPLILKMMESGKVGTINLTNPGVVSHNEILEMYKEIVDPSFTWKNFNLHEQDEILLSKRSNNQLDTSKLQEWFPSVLPIKDSIRKCLEQMKMTDKLREEAKVPKVSKVLKVSKVTKESKECVIS
jgi:3,5-epimerase/4-reductase